MTNEFVDDSPSPRYAFIFWLPLIQRTESAQFQRLVWQGAIKQRIARMLYTCNSRFLKAAMKGYTGRQVGERGERETSFILPVFRHREKEEWTRHTGKEQRGERAFIEGKLSHRRFLAMIWLYRWKEWFIINRWLEQILPVTRDVSRRERQRRRRERRRMERWNQR